jgi:uncharacterized protein (DUF1800 family)
MARGSRSVVRTAGGVLRRGLVRGVVGGSLLLAAGIFSGAARAQVATDFYTVPPCRLIDTRLTAGPVGGPALQGSSTRAFALGARCGVSSGAQAVAVNVTVLGANSTGFLNVFPLGAAQPNASTINFARNQTRANNAILGLGAGGAVNVRTGLAQGGEVHLVVDVAGYFADAALETTRTAPPVFDPPATAYQGEQSVEILTSTPGATIRYTTDGSAPSRTHGATYAGPLTLGTTTTLRAIAFKDGLNDSPEVAGTYTITRQALLLVAAMTPQSGAISLGDGSATLQIAENELTGVYRSTWRNLSSPLTAAHIHAPDGTILFDIDTTPPAADGSRTWTIVQAGTWTRAQILASLRAGQCYVNLHTSNYPNGEIKGNLRPANGSIVFVPPPPPPPLPNIPVTDLAAARFLIQASYGPRLEDVVAVMQQGYSGWINQQFALPRTTHMSYVDSLPGPLDELPSEHTRESIWKQAILGNDQLRQRVALALSEILVVSDRDDDLGGAEGIAGYMDILSRNAFGNFRTLLQEVTLSPAMGVYLDMASSDREDPETGRKPNENFARELLQLFSIGLYQLHPDGTLKLDLDGLPIPTYDQAVVEGFAKVFTGWTFGGQDHSEEWRFYWPERNWRIPMEPWIEHHSTAPKELLDGLVLAGNTPPPLELNQALDVVFLHPNVGPFVCRQLIQRLVTANPSPGYVFRCGNAFANNGAGVRGDMRAVVRAILLDWEARAPEARNQPGFGHVREPIVRFVHLLRSLRAQPPPDGRFRYYWGGSAEWGLNQQPLSAPTVFNFFEPSYQQPGPIASAGLVSPELQITNETSVFGTANYLRWVLRGHNDEEEAGMVTIDWSYLTGAANDAQRLDRVNLLFYGGAMSPETRTILATAMAGPNFTWTDDPVDEALTLMWLVALSPEFVAAY